MRLRISPLTHGASRRFPFLGRVGILALGLVLALPARPDPGAGGDTKRLELALAGIQRSSLQGDLGFLAADEMAGRDTPSPELWIAALFLRARLQRLGFQPGAGASYFHEYELTARGLDLDRSTIEIASGQGTERLVFGSDYYLARTSHLLDRDTAGGVVSVGSGSREAFDANRLRGRWALLFDRGASMRRTLRYAEKRGAVGVLFVQSPDDPDPGKPYAERYEATTRLLAEPHPSFNTQAAERNADEPAAVMLSPAGAAALLGASERDWSGVMPPSGFDLGLELREVRAVGQTATPVPNVAGFWPGSHPALAREVIVVSAHYDHIGTRGEDVFNGADDNASGTTGLLAVAEALAAYGPLARSVLLLWLSGEEKGLWGSLAWTSAPVLPQGCVPVANLNIDMIGRTRPGELYITPTRAHDAFNTLSASAYELSALEGFPELLDQDADWTRSDHFNFHRRLEIPVAFLSAGEHPDYHQPTDTVEKIDLDKLGRVARLVVRMLVRIQDQEIEYL